MKFGGFSVEGGIVQGENNTLGFMRMIDRIVAEKVRLRQFICQIIVV